MSTPRGILLRNKSSTNIILGIKLITLSPVFELNKLKDQYHPWQKKLIILFPVFELNKLMLDEMIYE